MQQKTKLKIKKFPIKINYNGDWFYNNSQIKRKPLIRLFSSVLKTDKKGNYFLETPAEKGQIDVEDSPFVVKSFKIVGTGQKKKIIFLTNIDEGVTLNQQNPLIFKKKKESFVPYIFINKYFEARILRSVYYELINKLVKKKKGANYTITSQGYKFKLK